MEGTDIQEEKTKAAWLVVDTFFNYFESISLNYFDLARYLGIELRVGKAPEDCFESKETLGAYYYGDGEHIILFKEKPGDQYQQVIKGLLKWFFVYKLNLIPLSSVSKVVVLYPEDCNDASKDSLSHNILYFRPKKQSDD